MPVQRISKKLFNYSQHTAVVLVSVAVLSGCVVGPNFKEANTNINNAVIKPITNFPQEQLSHNRELAWNWWTILNDPILTELEQKAQLGNLDIQMASSRIAQSRATLGIASSDRLPSVSAGFDYKREGLSENGKFVALGAPSDADNFWQLGFDASWELDLWGRNKRIEEGAIALLQASLFEREAVRVSLSGEVAKTYLLLRNAQTQLEITHENKSIAERVLTLAQSRERNGVSTRFETISAQAELATINATLPDVTQRRNILMNALALLIGEQPRALNTLLAASIPAPHIPTGIPKVIPSEFVKRRPDILQAQASLHSAVAAIGAAQANFYPRISLTGSLGVEGYAQHDLSTWDSRVFSVGPNVYLPIFQGGRLKSQLKLTKEREKTAALNYRQTVLKAWHEVDNAVDGWAAQQNHHDKIAIAHDYNKQALKNVERAYQQGAADYLSVLTAQRNLLASQTNLNNSSTNASLAVVSLYKSLGGLEP
ncbi:efflux transporter outer membrane subunit [Pseudoalteromonas sp. B129b]